MPDKVVPVRTYLAVCAVLLALTGLTVGLSFVNLRGWNVPLAMVIAAIKALLIALVFMHVRASVGMTRVIGLVALLWLAILLVGTLDDYLSRDWLPIPGR